MLGALAGDFVGSRFEFWPNKTREFNLISESSRPTDDTVLTIAVGDALAHGLDIAQTLRSYTMSYPASYGMHFRQWAYGQLGSDGPYGSWGNGAAMRVSTAAWLAATFEECMRFAEASAVVTHNHPEAVRSAKAVAAAIYAGLSGFHRTEIKAFIEKAFGYDLSMTVEDLMPSSSFELKSWISVQKAFVCAFEAETVEAAIRNAVYLGGDADTEAAIAGSIAETWSEPPKIVVDAVMAYFPDPLRRRVLSIQEKMRSVSREPLTVEKAMSLALWDPTELERWIANNDEREAASAAEAEADILRRFAKLNGQPTSATTSSPIRRLRRWLNWF
jgi:ADP-ribosylglycohydrolase